MRGGEGQSTEKLKRLAREGDIRAGRGDVMELDEEEPAESSERCGPASELAT